MESKSYRLSFVGQIAGGADPHEVKKKLAELFGTNIESIEQLFCGNPKVVKQNLDLKSAKKLKGVFEETGALCSIEPMPDDPEPSIPQSKAHQ